MTTTTSRRGSLSRRQRKLDQSDQLADNRCVLYIRASTEDQKHTLEAQQHEATRFAEANGKAIAESFVEPGVSGSKPFLQRPQARKALAHMKAEGIHTLLVLSLDRAFRSTVDMHLTVEHLLDQGFNFRVAMPDIDLRGPVGRLIASLLGALAEFELGCRSERQQRGFDSMRRQRIARSQNPPFGWDLGPESDQKSHSGRPYRTLLPNHAEQTVLRRMLSRYQQGDTLEQIAHWLNAEGVATKRAGQPIIRIRGKGTPAERRVTVGHNSGLWKKQTVKSVLEHADLAEDHDEPTTDDTALSS